VAASATRSVIRHAWPETHADVLGELSQSHEEGNLQSSETRYAQN